jgi:serine/threonine protein kinase/Flp pilus assembly protein TadD
VIAQQISHYRILEKIGAGGMGEVYLAEDSRLGRKLALKILPEVFTQDQMRVARFQQEARAASALNHPNIITIYEIGEEDGVHFIATEHIAGRTLRQHLRPDGMELREALEIATQVASALEAAHEAGITHRDIKPENVMIRPDGYVKVLDFGLAKLTEKRPGEVETGRSGEEESTLLLTATPIPPVPQSPNPPISIPGMVMGTVTYMSPEQARGLVVDDRSDIFSLGVLLYEMLTGRVPFDGATTTDVLAAILHLEPQPLSRHCRQAPEELEINLYKALRKDCDARYQTIRSFLHDLRQIKSRLDFETEFARIGHGHPTRKSGEEISEALTVEFRTGEVRLPPGRLNERRSSGQIESLAILPMENASADAGMEYLSDGITESIINSLSQLPGLRVVPRSTVFGYKGRKSDPQKTGEELAVHAVLTGRVIQLGDSLIVKTELIDVGRASQLWGEEYRRKLTDIFALQDEIAEEISQKLRLRLSGEDRQRLQKRYTDNTEAYHLYLKGRYYVAKRTPEWIRKGVEHFQQAIDLDPNYALAYSGLAEAYGFLASSTGGQPPRDAYPLAKAAALKALELDDTLGEAHCSLGFFRMFYDWDFPAAETEFKRAIELSPNFANAYDGYGFYLKATGQYEAAEASCKRAQELEPLSLFMTLSLGWVYYFARRWDEALAQSRKVLEMDPNFGFAYWHRGVVFIQQENFTEAINAFRKALNLSGGIPTFIAYLGHASARAGKHREARQMLAQLESLSKRQYVSAYFFAMIHLGLGDLDQTFEWLEKAYKEQSGFLAFVRVEPMLDKLKADSRFAELLKRMDS